MKSQVCKAEDVSGAHHCGRGSLQASGSMEDDGSGGSPAWVDHTLCMACIMRFEKEVRGAERHPDRPHTCDLSHTKTAFLGSVPKKHHLLGRPGSEEGGLADPAPSVGKSEDETRLHKK